MFVLCQTWGGRMKKRRHPSLNSSTHTQSEKPKTIRRMKQPNTQTNKQKQREKHKQTHQQTESNNTLTHPSPLETGAYFGHDRLWPTAFPTLANWPRPTSAKNRFDLLWPSPTLARPTLSTPPLPPPTPPPPPPSPPSHSSSPLLLPLLRQINVQNFHKSTVFNLVFWPFAVDKFGPSRRSSLGIKKRPFRLQFPSLCAR